MPAPNLKGVLKGATESHLRHTIPSPGSYNRELRILVENSKDLADSAARRTVKLLDQTRREVVDIINSLPEGSLSRPLYEQTLTAIDDAVTRFATQYQVVLTDAQAAGFQLGADIGIKPLTAAGVAGLDSVTRSINLDQLAITQGFSARFVQGVTEDIRKRINTEVAAVTVGAKTPHAAATAIGRNLKDRNHFSTMAHRARAITVTEVGRATSLGTQAAQTQLAATLEPEGIKVRKQWLNAHLPGARETHLEAEANYAPTGTPGPIPIDQPFQINGWPAMYPRDPSLPAAESVNCHCVSVTVLPDQGLDKPEIPKPKPKRGGPRPLPKTAPSYKRGVDLDLDEAVDELRLGTNGDYSKIGHRLLVNIARSPAATSEMREKAIAALKELYPQLPDSSRSRAEIRLLLRRAGELTVDDVPIVIPKTAPINPDVVEAAREGQRLPRKALVEKFGAEAVERFEQRVATEMTEAEIRINTPFKAAEQILDDGRIRSSFETGTRDASYQGYRMQVEQTLFGLPQEETLAGRPIYGHLEVPGAGDGAAVSYGHIRFVLKDEVKERATAFLGDSFDNRIGEPTVTRLAKPEMDSFLDYSDPHLDRAPSLDDIGFAEVRQTEPYVEVQVHGTVTVDDIARVDIADTRQGTPNYLINTLDELNIPYRFLY